MKKLLILISIFFSVNSYAQITPEHFHIKVSGGGSGDLSNYFTKGQIDSINAGYYTKDQVDSIVATINATIHINSTFSISYAGSGTSSDPYTFNVDSVDASRISGGLINSKHIPVANIDRVGAGVSTLRASNDTLHSSNIQGAGTVTITKGLDSSIIITGSVYIYVVPDIASLQSYSGSLNTVIVSDSLRGGTFNYMSTGVSDNGVVFSATGRGSGYWVRQYNTSLGVSVDWWGTRNDVSLRSAVAKAGVGGTINFTGGRTYSIIYGATTILSNQTLNGNGAILKRANDTVVTITSNILPTDSSFTVNAIPSIWGFGGNFQLFSDNTNTNQVITFQPLSIIGNTVKVNGVIGKAFTGGASYARAVFPILTSTNSNIVIKNLVFDGNKANNSANLSWTINTNIVIRGINNIIEGCSFLNSPNENIQGHGFIVTNCYGKNLNGSFVHLSTSFTNTGSNSLPSIITGNIVDSSNQIPTSTTGHSEGIITLSFTPGYVNIVNNRFKNGGESFLGYIRNSTEPADGKFRDVIVSSNYLKNFKAIVNSFQAVSTTDSLHVGHDYFSDNIFDNCGANDWTSLQAGINSYFDTIMVSNNLIVGGTTFKIPVLNSDSLQRYILNNPTTTSQKASLNVGSIITRDLKAQTANNAIFGTNVLISGNISFVDTTSSLNNRSYDIVTASPNITQYAIRPIAGDGAGVVFSTSQGGIGINYYTRTKLFDNGILGTLHTTNSTITYQYFGVGTDAAYNLNNLRLYPDKTIGFMTVNDVVGDFLTRNSSTGLLTRRTASETLSDIGALPVLAPYISKATSYTATSSDRSIEVTATGQTITLPTAVGATGRVYIVKLTASGTSTVATTSSQTIDGSTTYSLTAQYKYVTVESNGANWIIIGNN